MRSSRWPKLGLLLALFLLCGCRLLRSEEFSLPLNLLQEKVQIEISLMQFDASLAAEDAEFDKAAFDQLAGLVRSNMPDLLVLQGIRRKVLAEILSRLPAYLHEELVLGSESDPFIASLLLFRSDRFEGEAGRKLDVFLSPRAIVQRIVEKASGKSIFLAHGYWKSSDAESEEEYEDMYVHLKQRRSESDAILLVGRGRGISPEDTSMMEAFKQLYPKSNESKGKLSAKARQNFVYCESKLCKVLSAEVLKAMGPAPFPFVSWPILCSLRLEALERDRGWKIARTKKKPATY